MCKDPFEAVLGRLLELPPEAALPTLNRYVRKRDLSLPDLLLAALNKLPESGRIRREKDNLSLVAVGHMIDHVPDIDPRKGKIFILFQKALTRSRLRGGPQRIAGRRIV